MNGTLHTVTDPAVLGPLRPVHERYMAQMRAALPAPEADVQLRRRASEAPAGALPEVPPERRLTPVKPLLEIRFSVTSAGGLGGKDAGGLWGKGRNA